MSEGGRESVSESVSVMSAEHSSREIQTQSLVCRESAAAAV